MTAERDAVVGSAAYLDADDPQADKWRGEMQRRGMVNASGWFVHRLWRVPPVTVRTSHSRPLTRAASAEILRDITATLDALPGANA